MEVLRLLSDAGADLGEQVSVERTPGGLLRVAGIVETGERKAEILRALGPVTDNPAVLIEIRTVAEALAEKKGQGAKPATEQKVEIQSGSMAAESDLRSYFGGEEQARAFAARMVARSRRAVSHLYTLKNLSTRFSKDQLQRLSPEARGRWLSLLRSHAHAYRLEAEGLRQELRPVFFPSAPQGGAAAGPTPADIDGVVRAIDQLFAQGSANDRVILSAFTTSAQGATVTAIRAPQFWQSLLDAEGLAARIESAQ